MIEREFVKQNIREMEIEEFVSRNLKRVGHSHTKLQRTPLGEKIIIYTSHPGLVVGRKGQNIKKLTKDLKAFFNLENPQIETAEVESIFLDANIVAETIAAGLEKFGSNRFKAIGHRTMGDVIKAGALGIEIVISGKVPSSRAKSWRFYTGYLKKCGDISITGVLHAYSRAELKTGTVGIKVSIMPPNIKLPDNFKMLNEAQVIEEEITDEKKSRKDVKEKKNKKPKKKKIEKTEKKVKTQEVKKDSQLKVVEEKKSEPKQEVKKEDDTKAVPATEDKGKEASAEPVKTGEGNR